jgi:hypothetical protein
MSPPTAGGVVCVLVTHTAATTCTSASPAALYCSIPVTLRLRCSRADKVPARSAKPHWCRNNAGLGLEGGMVDVKLKLCSPDVGGLHRPEWKRAIPDLQLA